MDELEQVDRLREVAQVVDAQVAEARPVRQVVTCTRDRRRGYEHLPPWPAPMTRAARWTSMPT